MNLILSILILLSDSMYGCNDQDSKKEEPTANDNSAKPQSDWVCYASQGRDTINLSIRNIGDSVVGKLYYKIFEKDKNDGSVFGRFNGDTLYAEYVFESEGTDSRLQIAFLKKGDLLIQGFGPIEEKGNSQSFTDRSQIRFESGIELRKTACP